jgi:hypothetical protein
LLSAAPARPDVNAGGAEIISRTKEPIIAVIGIRSVPPVVIRLTVVIIGRWRRRITAG